MACMKKLLESLTNFNVFFARVQPILKNRPLAVYELVGQLSVCLRGPSVNLTEPLSEPGSDPAPKIAWITLFDQTLRPDGGKRVLNHAEHEPDSSFAHFRRQRVLCVRAAPAPIT